ncbi:MAG: hypothetical protein KatS3mg052_2516 [Candidatus Roseilinea sp.]|nr:MAG: hypothetical protein KatS3mg052_2516 [Candidatus Roseilinea sp.]
MREMNTDRPPGVGSGHWIGRFFGELLREVKHHTDPANHRPIHIAPVTHPVKRALVIFAGFGALGLAGIGAITPVMPVWPFALVALFCFARSSTRVRHWVSRNPIIKSAMSFIWSRPERPFAWARRCIELLSGAGGRTTSECGMIGSYKRERWITELPPQ